LKTIFAYPGNMSHAQNAALALAEVGSLTAYVTTFAYQQDGRVARILQGLPGNLPRKLNRELARRSITEVPAGLIHTYPVWEIFRTILEKAGASPPVVDQVWDIGSHRFDAFVADRYVPFAQAVHAFEYSALASFQRAASEGVARVLHLPSLDNGHYAAVQQRERKMWPDLASPHDAYFEEKFQRRQERRAAEIALADLLVCNSSLTAQSHIAAGADPQRVISVPLAAPLAIAGIRIAADQRTRPLRVIWAGPFSLRKGAHYLLEGWRELKAGAHAVLDVYGQQALSADIVSGSMEGIRFHGSVPQPQLFAAFERSDVLVFPTLSDGFGLVVAEALAQGLPVITTDQAGAADLLTKESGIIVPAADSHALAKALQWCLDNRDRLQAMRGPALEVARNRQWWDYRRDFIAALAFGLSARGYAPAFRPLPVAPISQTTER
jgi:glycosyltransferase involved in cell wall biosynthesis